MMSRSLPLWSLLAGVLLLACSDDTTPPSSDGPRRDHAQPRLEAGVDRPTYGEVKPSGDGAADHAALADLAPDLKACDDPGVVVGPGVTLRPTQLQPGGQVTINYRAPAKLASSGSLSVHYGVNFWAGAASTDATMTKQADGSFEGKVTLPADARLVDFVFFTQSGGSTTWDNNNSSDYHRSVGEPSHGPYLTFRDNLGGQPDRDPAQGLVVNFKSDHACVGRVRYGSSPTSLGGLVSESAAATMHRLVLTGLPADSLQHYRVECQVAGSCAAEASQVHQFRTAPSNPTSFSFIQISDPQFYRSANDHWKDVAAELSKQPYDGSRFLLCTGDHAADDTPVNWWDFFDQGRAVLASTPLVSVVGNHDASNGTTTSFEEYFAPQSSSGNPAYWGLRYGAASFLLLNSQTATAGGNDWQPGGAQRGWVQSTLSTITSSAWRFAAWHVPPYNVGVRHSNQQDAVRGVTSLFNDGVDWVLTGHEHLYQRTQPLRWQGSSPTTVASYGGTGGGVGYIVAPAAGHDPPETMLLAATSPERARLAYPTPTLINANNQITPWHGYVRYTINGKSITIEAFALGDAKPRDSVSYTKP